MAVIISVYDGNGFKHHLRTDGDNPNLIGFHYALDRVGVEILKDTYCETDLHYASTPGRGIINKPIPAGTKLTALYFWRNFYGSYFHVIYEGRPYDISVQNVKVL